MQHFDYFGVSPVLTRISRKLPTLVCLLQAHKHIRKQHLWQAYRWWLGELVLPTCRWNHLTTEVSQVMLASVNRCACQSHLHFSYSRRSIFSDTRWGREMCWKEFLTNLCPRWQDGSAAGAGWQVMCAQPPLNSCWDLHKLFYNMLHIGKLGRLPMSRLSPRDPISRGGIGGARVPSLMYLYLYLYLYLSYCLYITFVMVCICACKGSGAGYE